MVGVLNQQDSEAPGDLGDTCPHNVKDCHSKDEEGQQDRLPRLRH